MKIAYVIDALHTAQAGTESQLKLLIDGMQDRGHEVTLYVLRHTDFSRDCSWPCPITEVGFKSFYSAMSWVQAWQFRRRIIADGCDVIHGFFNDVALLIPVIFSFSPLRRFTSRRDMGIWYTPANLRILRLNAKTSCGVICNSRAVANYAQQHENLSQRQVKIVYNALREERSQDNKHQQPDEFTSALAKVAAGDVKVGLLANIKPLKQIETLINAAGELQQHGITAAHFFIMGAIQDETYMRKLLNLATELGVAERFHFTGPVVSSSRLLTNFDIGVLSSGSEGLSNTVIEFLQAGLATVVSDTGGNPELVTHEQTGLLFPPGDARALANQLEKLISDRHLCETLGDAAAKSAHRFSLATMCQTYEKIYRQEPV